ncbi:MAG TPA: winged helix-turn-helix domain-containing protein, partial [Intrasporangium sp.]|nr:winged helix-turn-helix domain-containing protein [Intrasporangium sp.]
MKHRGWTFLTNHGHVLVCVSRDPDATIREIANRVGITERAVQAIVS